MSYLEIVNGQYFLDSGTQLLKDINFKIAEDEKAVLIGPNGTGKTTLINIIKGDKKFSNGSINFSGKVGFMPQFIGQSDHEKTIYDLLLLSSTVEISTLAQEIKTLEETMGSDVDLQMKYAQKLAQWSDIGGYSEEVRWEKILQTTLALDFEESKLRKLDTLSGGQQKKIFLESLETGPYDMLILDEPDNYLDVPGKKWLEDKIRSTSKTVLFITHDREIISQTASKIITLENIPGGNSTWVHTGPYSTYFVRRQERENQLVENHKRWNEEEEKLKNLVAMYKQKAAYNDGMASRYKAAQTRLAKFQEQGKPEALPQEQELDLKLQGSRTGKIAVSLENVYLEGLLENFTMEIWYKDRIALLGRNGTGKTHLLKLLTLGTLDSPNSFSLVSLSGRKLEFKGKIKLGSNIKVGYFSQTHEKSTMLDATLVEILHKGTEDRQGLDIYKATAALNRYGLKAVANNHFDQLSGGQQARFQILLLELSGANLLLLDEPTDNLDIESAEALEHALKTFNGTVIAVTHDRWFTRSFDTFLIFNDKKIRQSNKAVWD